MSILLSPYPSQAVDLSFFFFKYKNFAYKKRSAIFENAHMKNYPNLVKVLPIMRSI